VASALSRVTGLLFFIEKLDWVRVKNLGGNFLQLRLEYIACRYQVPNPRVRIDIYIGQASSRRSYSNFVHVIGEIPVIVQFSASGFSAWNIPMGLALPLLPSQEFCHTCGTNTFRAQSSS